MKNISSIHKLVVGVVMIFIFAFLLKVGHIGVVINCFIEIVDLFICQSFLWIFQELMIEVETELSLSVAKFV